MVAMGAVLIVVTLIQILTKVTVEKKATVREYIFFFTIQLKVSRMKCKMKKKIYIYIEKI